MGKRTITAEDLQNFQWPGNPNISPDGKWVVYERTVINKKADDYETQLWLANVDGASSRVLTSTGTRNTSAVWAPDGRHLAFVSNRAFGWQVWLLPMEGGEPRQVTRFRYGMRSLVFSPDGKTLFGLVPVARGGEVEVFADDVSDKEAREQSEKADKDWANQPKRYDWLYYKGDGSGLSKGHCLQLVAVDVASGAYLQLTHGDYDVHSPAVSPDGNYVAFVSNRRENHEVVHASDVYRVPAKGGDVELLCSDVIAYQLSYSPDGASIALYGHKDEFQSATHTHLYILASDVRSLAHLTKKFPDTVQASCLSDMRANVQTPGPVWSQDGKFIFALSTREGRCEVVRFSVDDDGSEAAVVAGGDRDIYGFAFHHPSTLVLSYGTPTHPGKIVVVDIAGGETASRVFRDVKEPMTERRVPFFPEREVRLDDCNDAIVEELILTEPEPFWYTSAEGWRVQGWVLKPAHFEEGKKYPVIVEVHGGPQLNYGYAMFHEMQWFAAQGYAIVFVNPRGSMSYGQEFVNAVRHHYGENDAADVLHGLDAALEQFDFLDGNRVALTGGSYGGFMTNWLVGHTDRFFAAVSQRSISNWISFYGVSDIGPLFVEAQHGCDIYNDVEKLWDISPLKYAANVTTPLLLIHSENDLRCPIEQAEQFYTAIKRRGGEVELFRIPNASHGLSRDGKPSLRLERLKAIFHYIHERLPQAQ
ncbi:S9 family peptidase [Alicyclobacillus pomorum]|uniref:S9 family peptidase n=1 Tax=Alicyclobacillus pomorum TaxID=204470 RepID=UPI000420EC35|nr:S9 family peptidase [Alicyclobacillus pomorum]